MLRDTSPLRWKQGRDDGALFRSEPKALTSGFLSIEKTGAFVILTSLKKTGGKNNERGKTKLHAVWF